MIKIVADSSANLISMDAVEFASAPLKILLGEDEYVDVPETDLIHFMKEMNAYKGKSSTACPSVGDWLDAFGDADTVFGVSLTSKLSGGYNSACIAAEQYMEEHPDRKVFILDSLSTGPEMEVICEKYRDLILEGKSFEEIVEEIKAYSKNTSLAFILGSLNNFAKNGRVSPAVAKMAGLLNIRIVGRASSEGELEPLNKCRGEKKSILQMWENIKAAGYQGGRIRIRHTENVPAAVELKKLILAEFPDADLKIGADQLLCSYYTETLGLLAGFETIPAAKASSKIMNAMHEATETVTDVMRETKDTIVGTVKYTTNNVMDKVQDAAGPIKEKMLDATDSMKEKVQTAAGPIKEKMHDATDSMKEKVQGATGSMKEKVQGATGSMMEKVQGAAGTMKEKIQNVSEHLHKEK